MNKKLIFIKILAVTGNIIVWLINLAPFIFSAITLFVSREFRFDYLIPAELFPFAFIAGGLLLWSSLLKHSYQKLICWSYAVAFGSLVLGQILAMVTGLASGDINPSGWPYMVVMASIIIYVLGLILEGIGGLLLLKRVYSKSLIK